MTGGGISGRHGPRVEATHPQPPRALISGVPARAGPDDQHSPASQSLRRRLETPLIVEHPPQDLGLRRHRLTHDAHRNHLLLSLTARHRRPAQVAPQFIGCLGEHRDHATALGERGELWSGSWRRAVAWTPTQALLGLLADDLARPAAVRKAVAALDP